MKNVTVELKPGDLRQAKDFAGARRDQIDTNNYYSKRGQKNTDKIEYDCYVGALGEIAIYRFLKRLGIKATAPDFNIYDAKNKSFAADMTDNKGNNFHCKSQSDKSQELYGTAWIFQYDGIGMGHKDPLFKNYTNKDYLVLCSVNPDAMEVDIYGVIQVENVVKKDLLTLPDVDWLKTSKRKLGIEEVYSLSWYERWGRLKKSIML